jgi:hypothetical protein
LADQPTSQTNPSSQSTVSQSSPYKASTNEIDTAVNAVLAFSSNEQTLSTNENEEATIYAADSQNLNDYLQTYDENEF